MNWPHKLKSGMPSSDCLSVIICFQLGRARAIRKSTGKWIVKGILYQTLGTLCQSQGLGQWKSSTKKKESTQIHVSTKNVKKGQVDMGTIFWDLKPQVIILRKSQGQIIDSRVSEIKWIWFYLIKFQFWSHHFLLFTLKLDQEFNILFYFSIKPLNSYNFKMPNVHL